MLPGQDFIRNPDQQGRGQESQRPHHTHSAIGHVFPRRLAVRRWMASSLPDFPVPTQRAGMDPLPDMHLFVDAHGYLTALAKRAGGMTKPLNIWTAFSKGTTGAVGT